jgi:hypothetical protein
MSAKDSSLGTWKLLIWLFLLLLSLSVVPGQVNADDAGTVTVVIIPAAASINVTSPNGGENWVIGSTQAITWSSISVTGRVKIELSRNDGATWTTIIFSTSDDGNRNWGVTGPATTSARIKVTSISSPAVYDISDASFTIAPRPVWIRVISPDGGENWEIGSRQTITWDSLNVPFIVRVELSRDGGETWDTISYFVWNDGRYSWRVTGPATTAARIKVTDIFNPAVFDISDADFTITSPPPSITVISPNGGESSRIGTSKRITWDSKNVTGRVKIELSRNSGATWVTIVASTANDGGYTWRVTGPATTRARIKVSSTSNPAVFDISDADFTIGR